MNLPKLPSFITENEFDENGLVKTINGLMVPAYVGSQIGFNKAGSRFLQQVFYPELKKRMIYPLCPFTACAEYLDFSKLSDDMPVSEYTKFWDDFNHVVGAVNYETLMPISRFMVALFDGSHASDDGLCSEVAHFASHYGPVIGIRSDFRLAENIAAPINPAIRYFIDQGKYNGVFYSGPNAYEDAYSGLEKLANKTISDIIHGQHP
ncbi:MAG: hypothetical protein ABIF10_06450 [Candidatus Woesearchaeota archaeon]